MSILMLKPLPLSKPHLVGNEKRYVDESIALGKLSGDGPFTKKVRALLENELGARQVLLTTSCTSALELAALLLLDDPDRDEVIVPSFTFVSTVNAFLVHGFKPVFCDVRADTGNMDIETVAPLVNGRTRAIVPVHYAGIPCDMKPILDLARKHDIAVVEDAAQALFSTLDGKAAGTFGTLGCFSFHDTKNFTCGEGGAILVNSEEHAARAEIMREKGTNRSQFLQGHVDKYTWVDVGGSFLSSDLLAAFLLGQLEGRQEIGEKRAALYQRYAEGFAPMQEQGLLRMPTVPAGVDANHHLFFIVVKSSEIRARLMKQLNDQAIGAAFHYPALHTTPMGRRLHETGQRLPVAEELGERLLRLPLHPGLTLSDVDRVIDSVAAFYR